ncbi:hypothetical protein [Aminipila sp.]|uniref:hypothetical protein n=1 Tax=Aminipila sp. TaxID=2060095 RepID=UPI00289ACCFA|nr:hypothetical protein [Aminipila sp.]
MDKNSLMIGIAFLIGSAYCILELVTKEFKSFTLTGLILFTLVGIAFIRKSKSR